MNQAGTQIALVATAVWLRRSTNSAGFIGLLATAAALPVLFLSPLGGALADRWLRRNSLVVWDSLSGLVSCMLMLLLRTSLPVSEGVCLIFFAAVFLASASAFTAPAFNAFVPDLVLRSELQKAIAINQAAGLVAIIVGQAVGGLLIGHYPPYALFGIDAATYFFSAAATCFIQSTPVVVRPHHGANPVGRLWVDIQEGLSYVWERRGMRVALLSAIPLNMLITPVFVFLPFYTTNALHEPVSKYGYLLAIFSLGLLIGYVLASRVGLESALAFPLVVSCVLWNASVCIVLSVLHWYVLAGILLFTVGCGSGIVTLISLNVITARSDPDKRGRVAAILVMIVQGLTPATMSVLGVLTDMLHGNVRPLYATCGVALLVVGIALSRSEDLLQFFQSREEQESRV